MPCWQLQARLGGSDCRLKLGMSSHPPPLTMRALLDRTLDVRANPHAAVVAAGVAPDAREGHTAALLGGKYLVIAGGCGYGSRHANAPTASAAGGTSVGASRGLAAVGGASHSGRGPALSRSASRNPARGQGSGPGDGAPTLKRLCDVHLLDLFTGRADGVQREHLHMAQCPKNGLPCLCT